MPALEYHSTSSARYNGARQVHQNTVRFNPARHCPERALPPQVIRMATSLCCRRCQLIIRWKIDYGKYPSVTHIRRSLHVCAGCREKNVAIPFHHLCQPCAEEAAVCAKCQKTVEESEALAHEAVRKKQVAKGSDDDDEESDNDDEEEKEDAKKSQPSSKAVAAAAAAKKKTETSSDDDEEEEEEDDYSDDDDDAAAARHGREQQQQQTKQEIADEEERARQAEEDFPQLVALRGLDISVLRQRLYEERKADAMAQLKAQGRMRERDRRSAMRKLNRGEETAAAEVVAQSVAMLSEERRNQQQQQRGGGDNDNGAAGNGDNNKDHNRNDAFSGKARMSANSVSAQQKAGATSSDEETI